MFQRRCLLSALLFIFLSACSEDTETQEPNQTQQEPNQNKQEPNQNKQEQSKTESIRVVFWNDFHSQLYEEKSQNVTYGGLPVFMGAIRSLQGDGLSILIDGGDMFEGSPVLNASKGLGAVEIMNTLGIAASTLGNHEFDYGANAAGLQGYLSDAIQQSKFNWVCSNVQAETGNTTWPPAGLKPYQIIEKGPYRIAITGLSTQETPLTTSATNIHGLSFESPAVALTRIIPQIASENPDFTIVIAHLSGEPVQKQNFNQLYTNVSFTEEMGEVMALPDDILKHIDLIAAGHEHSSFMAQNGHLIAVENIHKGNELTSMTLIPDEDGKLKIDISTLKKVRLTHDPIYGGCEKGYENVPKTLNAGGLEITPDADGIRLTSEFEAKANLTCGTVACTTEEMYRDYDGESGLGNLFTDAQKSQFPSADAAVMNVGALRTSLKAGSITEADIEAVMPFSNTGNLVNLTGRQIIQMLQISSTLHKGALQVSGISYQFNPNCGRTKADLNGDGKTENWEINCLCDNVTINDVPVDPTKQYKVVMSDYILNGGDGLEGIIKAEEDLIEGGELILPYIQRYIKTLMPDGSCFGNSTVRNNAMPRIKKGACSQYLD